MQNDTSQNIPLESPKNLNVNENFWGLDVIRIIAMFFVVLVHSTTFYGFKEGGITSLPTFIAGFGRYLSMSCIPLFLMLTGYLNCNKAPSFNYYVKLLKILIEFLLCGITIAVINKFCFNNTASAKEIITKMFTFKFPSYSWYINMFMGLYLFIPFFNYLYKSIPEKHKWTFIISLFLVFSTPRISSYWVDSYPVMYYFLGVFLKDKQFKINKLVLGLGIFILCIIQTLIVKYHIPIYGTENHNNIGCLFISVAIFLLFYDLKSPAKPNTIKPLRIIANASLSTFLISQVFETLTQNWFNKLALTNFMQKLPYLSYLTPIKFVASVICGLIIVFIATQLFKLLLLAINKIAHSIKKSNADNTAN